MKKKQYPIDQELTELAKFKIPLDRIRLPILQSWLLRGYNKETSDNECLVERKYIPFDGKTMQCFLYSPIGIDQALPLLIYYHGGGFVLPIASHHFVFARRYCADCRCKVLVVDYPVAPKNKFPAAPIACYEAYKWVLKNIDSLNILPNKIAVGGDSAGGNLSAVVSMLTSENKLDYTPCAQMLLYPAVGSHEPTQSMKDYIDTPICNSKDYEKYCRYYFKSNKDKENKLASPLYAHSFATFPTTYLEIAEYDCLRDEGLQFGEQLKNAGAEVHFNITKGTMHGYDMATECSITKHSLQKRKDFLNYVFSL